MRTAIITFGSRTPCKRPSQTKWDCLIFGPAIQPDRVCTCNSLYNIYNTNIVHFHFWIKEVAFRFSFDCHQVDNTHVLEWLCVYIKVSNVVRVCHLVQGLCAQVTSLTKRAYFRWVSPEQNAKLSLQKKIKAHFQRDEHLRSGCK